MYIKPVDITVEEESNVRSKAEDIQTRQAGPLHSWRS